MQAIEFETYIKNGVIEIPERYKDFNEKKIKVIIMAEEDKPLSKDKIDRYLESVEKYSFDLPTDYKFDRDELHER